MAEPVGVFAIAAVGRPAARLDIGAFPRVGPKRAQHRRRVERPRPHFHVVGLEDQAAALRPIMVQRQDQVLEAQGQGGCPNRAKRKRIWCVALAQPRRDGQGRVLADAADVPTSVANRAVQEGESDAIVPLAAARHGDLGPRRDGRQLRTAAAHDRGRPPRAVARRRCRHDHLSVRHDPHASAELCLAQRQARQGLGQIGRADRRNADRREESRSDSRPTLPSSAIAPASRRSSTASRPDKRAALYRGDRPVGTCRRRIRPDGNLGRRASCCSASSSRLSTSRARTGSNRRCATAFAGDRQADRPARNQRRAIGLLRSIVGRPRSASCSKARSTARRRCASQFDDMLKAWTQGDVDAIAKSFNAEIARLARTARCLARPAQRQLGGLGRTAHGPAGKRDGRGRRRPPRRRRFGAGHAAAAWLSSHSASNNRTGVNFSPRKLTSQSDTIAPHRHPGGFRTFTQSGVNHFGAIIVA